MTENSEDKQQNSTEFDHNDKMVAFADAYVLNQGNITKAFESLNKDRTIYYITWRKMEGFDEWLGEYARKQVLSRRGKWYLILEKYAEAGSFQHLDRLLQIADEFTPVNKVQLEGGLELNIAGKFQDYAKELAIQFGRPLPE